MCDALRCFGLHAHDTEFITLFENVVQNARCIVQPKNQFACVHDLVFAEVPGPLVNPLRKSCGVGAEVSESDGLLKWLRYRPEHDVKMLTCMFFLILHD